MTFTDLKLSPELLRALSAEGYQNPTPIQAQAIPHALLGKDVLGVAQTGTGKTAAFALPILQRLAAHPHKGERHVRCLVLTPTRELAAQVGESFATYGKHLPLRHTVVFGGVGQNPQEQAIRRGVDILVATPGRLLDLVNQRVVSFNHLEVFVLDEADRMLDMGFLPDVRRIIATLPKKRQTLFFSATMPPDITALARSILVEPIRVEVTPVSSTAETVEQHVYFVEREDKRALLVDLLKDPKLSRALVFTRTKHGANRVAQQLDKAGIKADAIHGNKGQGARERALDGFKDGSVRVLVATDIAARGIDVEAVSHVINFELPNVPEQYVHRIGRTGRAGARGIALSFCDAEERGYLADIEKIIRRKVPVVTGHPYHSNAAPRPPAPQGQRQQRSHRGGGGGGNASRSHGQRRGQGGRSGSASGHGRGASAGSGGHKPSHGGHAPRAAAPSSSAPARPTRQYSKW